MEKKIKWTNEYRKQYQKAYQKAYREKYDEEIKQRGREYYYANRERVRATQAEYRDANRVYFEIYRKANVHKYVEYNRKYHYNKRFTIET